MSPETVARSVQRLNAAGVAWPTTRRVAITVRLAGLADVIALGDGVVAGPTAVRAAVGHVLRAVGQEADPAAALREISETQQVLSLLERMALERLTADLDPVDEQEAVSTSRYRGAAAAPPSRRSPR